MPFTTVRCNISLQSPYHMTDQNGAIVAQYSYDAYGNILSQSGTMAAANPLRYAGYRYDEATGLYYLMARYYDANIGRFITRDTFYGFEDEPQSLNLYVYCKNNPVNYIDPDGHNPVLLRAAVKYVQKLAIKYGKPAAKQAYSYMKPWFKKVRDIPDKYSIKFTISKGDNFSIKIFKNGIKKPVARLEFHYELGKYELDYHVGDKRAWRKVIWDGK